MPHIRCPELDLLTDAHNEAYRKAEGGLRCFSAHRVGCVLYKVQSSALPETYRAPVSRHVM
jgi:hypothetical protein